MKKAHVREASGQVAEWIRLKDQRLWIDPSIALPHL